MTLYKAAVLSAFMVMFSSWSAVEARSKMVEPLFSYGFPETRRGRATPPAAPPAAYNEPPQEILDLEEVAQPRHDDSFLDKVLDEEQMIMEAIKSLNIKTVEPERHSHHPAAAAAAARKVEDSVNQFAPNMNRLQSYEDQAVDNFPQLRGRQASDPAAAGATTDEDGVRCIPKVMQIEEIVYDRAIKCHHSYQEKCHLTYITDYQSTSEEKCETTFKKNCHITFKPMPFNETVSICNTPIERSCGTEAVGPDICSTQYETNCETRYNTYEVEQDEPVCTMELMKKCKNVTVTIPRARRQAEETTLAPDSGSTDTEAPVTDAPGPDGEDGETLTFDQKCEEWPVQKCTLEKKMVKKVHPETACKKIPREVCVPNNCETVQGKEICYDEVRMQVQNVPQEECELQPEETCHMESVLVPRLVPQPNCVKVPKEICVNTKTNPRKVKKPIVKEWCYKPSDLAANGGTA